MAPGRSCLTPNGLGVLLDTELTEPADRRLPARLRRQAAVKPGPAGAVKQPVRFRAQCSGRGSDAALRRGLRASRSTQNYVPLTLLNWRKTDICILR